MISKVIAEILVYFKEILGRCALCRFSLAVFVCSSVCLVDVMVTVYCDNLNACILLELFKPCGKLSVSLILTVGGEVARKDKVFHAVLFCMLGNACKSRFENTDRLIRLPCKSGLDALHESLVVVACQRCRVIVHIRHNRKINFLVSCQSLFDCLGSRCTHRND